MQTYHNKQALISEIEKRYTLYDREFEPISNLDKDLRKAGVEKTPAENLAYQLGWTDLLLSWEAAEKKGLSVITPSADYKWNNLGGLYQSFYQQYASYSLSERRELLQRNVHKVIVWLNTLTETEIFQPEQRHWASNAAKWPIYKWVHINTVAPFKNFRTQIRKWKKL